jgi:hypothetical protein
MAEVEPLPQGGRSKSMRRLTVEGGKFMAKICSSNSIDIIFIRHGKTEQPLIIAVDRLTLIRK